MKSFFGWVFVALGVSAIFAGSAVAGGLSVAKWEAGTCNANEIEVKECRYTSPHSFFYTQAAGHPPWGLTGFELKNSGAAPEGSPLKRIRVDVPPGLAADPQALDVCSRTDFESNKCAADTKAGFVELKAYVEIPLTPQTLTLKGSVYNLPQEPGLPLVFGIDVEGVPPLVEDVHLLLEGHVSFAHEESLAARGIPSGDFHEWFEINNVPTEVSVKIGPLEVVKAALKTVESKLFFDGHAGKEGKENFLTMPSDCGAPPTAYLELETYPPVEKVSQPTTPPVGVEGCDKVPFAPTATVTTKTPQYDSPDGATTDVHVPQLDKAKEINTADIDDAHVTLPEGLTLDPPAARGLEACTPSQLHRGSSAPVECPAASKIGTVDIETDLPPGSLAGNVYLGKADGTDAIKGPPYLIFIDAESVYDVSVRLEGQVVPNPSTGRLEVSFLGNPQLPFSDLILTVNGGPGAPLANPLACGNAPTQAMFSPYTTGILQALEPTPFMSTGCPNPIPFALAQTTQSTSTAAGANTSYTLNLTRGEGQQYLSQVKTTMPEGLLGPVPSVTLCGEPQAQQGTCPASSLLGSASVTAGSGSEPFPFTGSVYLTGPYNGAPYGLSVVVPATAGPFNLGNDVTRAAITVDPYTARLIVASNLQSVFQGVPLRLRSIQITVDRLKFLQNPTNCGAHSTDTTLTSTFGATQNLSSPFTVTGCSSLPFKPKFSVSTSAKTSLINGAALKVKLTSGAGQANIGEVFAELPKQLPARLTTLQKACTEAVFNANPAGCPKESKVGTAVAHTPILDDVVEGPAYLVSHGGQAFPDLELILNEVGPKGEVITPGIQVILDGKTHIAGAITSSKFAAIPDVPITSFELTLPSGRYSALTANGNLCKARNKLVMPTTLVGQGGQKLTQRTKIAVTGCPVLITKVKVGAHAARITILTPSAGRLTLSGKDLKTVKHKVSRARSLTLTVRLSSKGIARLSSRRALKLKLLVSFRPKSGARSHAHTRLKFR